MYFGPTMRQWEMEEPPNGIGANEGRSVAPLAWIGFALGLVALFFCGATCMGGQWPPKFEASWVVGWVLCLSVAVLGLLAAKERSNPLNRLVCTTAIGLALLGSWLPSASFYGERVICKTK